MIEKQGKKKKNGCYYKSKAKSTCFNHIKFEELVKEDLIK